MATGSTSIIPFTQRSVSGTSDVRPRISLPATDATTSQTDTDALARAIRDPQVLIRALGRTTGADRILSVARRDLAVVPGRTSDVLIPGSGGPTPPASGAEGSGGNGGGGAAPRRWGKIVVGGAVLATVLVVGVLVVRGATS